jgi:alpha/beta superfamily hydrolase
VSFVDVPAPHGRLEALLWTVEAPGAAAVVCHPHPQQGGTMHNHVTYRIGDAFRKAGVAALRFNFRGVGRSTGTYDGGRGEVDDARAALDFLADLYPGAALVLAGFSFGAHVALRLAAADRRVTRALAAGVPLDAFDFDAVRALTLPRAFIHGERDELTSLDRVRRFVAELPPPTRLFVVPGSDHLATGVLPAFERTAADAVAWLMAA